MDFQQRSQDNSMGKVTVFSTDSAGTTGYARAKDDAGSESHTTHED